MQPERRSYASPCRAARGVMTLAIVAIITSVLMAGCGGATPSSTAPTSSAASESNPNRGRDFPPQFEVGFVSSCIETNTRRTCACMLATIESHATHAMVLEQIQDSRFVASPEYQLALRTCHGH